MKKLIVILLAAVLACCAFACGNSLSTPNNSDKEQQIPVMPDDNQPDEDDKKPDEEKPEPPAINELQAIADADFSYGFRLLGTDSATDGTGAKSIVKFGRQTPVWSMAQWYTRYDFNLVKPVITTQKMTIDDQSKHIELDRTNGKLTLALDATKEYDESASSRVFWPHLLIEQSFSEEVKSHKLSEFESLTASVDFSITKANKGAIETKPASETLPAQFLQFYYINDFKNDAFLWFGLAFFDTRYEKTTLAYSQDFAGGNAGNFIYSLGAETLMNNENFVLGKEYEIELDILPYISQALDKAKESGFMPNTHLSDCIISGVNIGWELPGAWDVSATLGNISLQGILK